MAPDGSPVQPPDEKEPMNPRIARRPRPLGALLLSLVGLVVAAPVSAASDVSFHVVLDTCRVEGTGAAGSQLRVVHRSPGIAAEGITTTVRPDGTWAVCFDDLIEVADRVIIRDHGNAIGAVTVPDLRLQSNRYKDTVTGRAPAGSAVTLDIAECPFGTDGCQAVGQLTPVPGSDGSFILPLVAVLDLRGGHRLDLTWKGPDHSSVTRRSWVGRVVARLGDARVTGSAGAPGPMWINLFDDDGPVASTHGVAAPDGTFSIVMRDQDDHLVPVADNAPVEVEGAARVHMRARMSIQVLAGLVDGIVGRCMPEADVRLRLRSPSGGSPAVRRTTADIDGHYAFGNLGLDQHHQWTAEVTCRGIQGDLSIGTKRLP